MFDKNSGSEKSSCSTLEVAVAKAVQRHFKINEDGHAPKPEQGLYPSVAPVLIEVNEDRAAFYPQGVYLDGIGFLFAGGNR